MDANDSFVAGASESNWWRWSNGIPSVSNSAQDNGNINSYFISRVNSESATNTVANHSEEKIRWQKRGSRPLKDLHGLAASTYASRPSANNSLFSIPDVAAASPPTLRPHAGNIVSDMKADGINHINTGLEANNWLHSMGDTASASFASSGSATSSDARSNPYSDVKWSLGTCTRRAYKKDKRLGRTSLSQSRLSQASNISSQSKIMLSEKRSAFSSQRALAIHLNCTNASSDTPKTMVVSSSQNTRCNASASIEFCRSHQNAARPKVINATGSHTRSSEANVRKRTVEGLTKGEFMEHCNRKTIDIDSSASSFSDEDMQEIAAMESSLLQRLEIGSHGIDDIAGGKLWQQDLIRQSMLYDSGICDSPDNDRFSPLLKDKGLPVEVRYQLPLALCTANETDKECTICRLFYGIGDHIVTLPCQHFFHACCVDKWLWNHKSCPLCRTKVSLEQSDQAVHSKHRFEECSQSDREQLRRILRSTSHSAGFRPVVPATSKMDRLNQQIAQLQVHDNSPELLKKQYLVCPTPRRHERARDQI